MSVTDIAPSSYKCSDKSSCLIRGGRYRQRVWLQWRHVRNANFRSANKPAVRLQYVAKKTVKPSLYSILVYSIYALSECWLSSLLQIRTKLITGKSCYSCRLKFYIMQNEL